MIKKYLYIICMLAAMLLPTDLMAAAPGLVRADSAYSKGDYALALQLYRQVEQRSGSSAELLFNMGNAYYKEGDDAGAMLCYRRAHKLDPDNERINDNLRFLTSRVSDLNKAELKGKKGNLDPDPLSFFQKVYKGIVEDTASDYWASLAALAFIIFIAGVAIYVFTPTVMMKKIGFFSALIMFLFAGIFTVFAVTAGRHYYSRQEAVLTDFKTELLEEPSTDARKIGVPLHKGTPVEVIEVEDGVDSKPAWYKVRLNDDNIGWVASGSLEVI